MEAKELLILMGPSIALLLGFLTVDLVYVVVAPEKVVLFKWLVKK